MQSDDKNLGYKFQYPSLNTIQRLFEAAYAYYRLAPWQWMDSQDVVAVHDPLEGRIAYCVVLGGQGLPTGFDALLGDHGLVKCREIRSNKMRPEPNRFFYNINSLSMLLALKKDLTLKDKSFCKKAGLMNAWDEYWPLFRKFEPGYFPWYLQEADAAFLAVCLEGVIDVAKRAKLNSGLFGPRDNQTFLARIPQKKDGTIVWKEEFITPKPMERVILIKPKVDHALLKQRLGNVTKSFMVWEADCFGWFKPVIKKGKRPFYPFCYAIADHGSDYIFHADLVEEGCHGALFLIQICEAVKKIKILPEKILIRQPHLLPLFAPLAAYGIATEIADKLPVIENAREQIYNSLTSRAKPQTKGPVSLLKHIGEEKIKSLSKKLPEKLKMAKVYQFKVTLDDVEPAIWRKFQVESNITLKRLAATILIVMGWTNTHLHQFRIRKKRYGIPHEDFQVDDYFEDEGKFNLNEFKPKELVKFGFAYDFGDGWEHTVVLEEGQAKDEDVNYPVCISGARRCPRENCGGPYEYENFLRIIKNPKDPEYPATIDLVDGSFDPESFDVDSVNRALKHVAQEEKYFDQWDN